MTDRRLIEVAFPLKQAFARLGAREERAPRTCINAASLAGAAASGSMPCGPFAGGGTIPLEAMRLGCEVTAFDINPVAWFILQCTHEYPQKLAGQKRPSQTSFAPTRSSWRAFSRPTGTDWPCDYSRASGVSILMPQAGAASAPQVSASDTRASAEVALRPNQLQDFVDVLPDILKATAGSEMTFRMTVEINGKERPSDKTVANKHQQAA